MWQKNIRKTCLKIANFHFSKSSFNNILYHVTLKIKKKKQLLKNSSLYDAKNMHLHENSTYFNRIISFPL